MATNKIVTIKGRKYDAVTGLPVDDTAASKPAAAKPAPKKPVGTPRPDIQRPVQKATTKPAPRPKTAPAQPRTQATSTAVHSTPQRSQTLIRRSVKKPTAIAQARRPGERRHMDVAISGKVARFAPHPAPKRSAPADTLHAPQTHPSVQRALQRQAAAKHPKVAIKPATSKEVKNAAITAALAAPKPKAKKKGLKGNKWVRRFIIVGSIALVIAVALFLVYRFIPSVSVGLAGSQAGVQATYPEYIPDGYSLSQPVTYSDGEVILKFNSNSSESSYSVTQTNSTWDSSAVLDKVVRPATGENYVTTRERGLTLYSYDNNAAWVTGGILYVIESNAPLSGDQIRRIAVSL